MQNSETSAGGCKANKNYDVCLTRTVQLCDKREHTKTTTPKTTLDKLPKYEISVSSKKGPCKNLKNMNPIGVLIVVAFSIQPLEVVYAKQEDAKKNK